MEKLKLRLPGVAVPSPGDGGFGEFASVVGAEVKVATRVDAARAAGSGLEGILSEAEESDVLQLSWDRDVVELVRAGELSERFGTLARGSGGEIVIPTLHAFDEGKRGEGALRLSAIEHIAVKAAQKLTDALLPDTIRAIEGRLMPRPGVFELDAGGELVRQIQAGELSVGAPLLVLLHGCFSDTRRSFRDLFPSKEWRALYDGVAAKGGKVLALEHHTVTQSPVENALELARVLPQGAKLRLLSYSRGGLIGDLLVRHPWEAQHAAHFFPQRHYPDAVRDELRELSELLGAAQVRVEHYLRVAAPAAGTLLASTRLDVYLNVILSMLTKLLEAGNPWLSFVKAIATQIVATRTKPDACPGLEAMMPHLDRGLIPFLNAAPKSPTEDLAVIAGDVEGGHAFQRIKSFFAKLYFQEENDFVVDTRSMYRGVPRARAWAHLHAGPNAHHFGYFSDESLRGKMLAWLARGDAAQFRLMEDSKADIEARGGAFGFGSLAAGDLKPVPGRDVVVLLPGIMGSHLSIKGNRLWVDFWELAWGGLRKLALTSSNEVAASGLIDGYYGQLAKYLSRTWNVEIFAFDWRRPIAESADKLRTRLAALRASGVRVKLIAHSMGGLVSRACIAKNPDLWRDIVQHGGRLVMLGTPNYGSYVPARAFAGQHALLRTIERLDVTSDLDQLTGVVRAFPGLLEMLPRREKHDLLSFAAWRSFESHRPGSLALEQASTFRDWLDARAIQPDSMVYVAGQADETPVAMALTAGKVMFEMSTRGDGTVPWDLGILPNVDTYYVDCEHGDLAKHERSFAGYHDLLQSGKTTRLGKSPVRSVRAAEGKQLENRWVSEAELPEIRYFPSEEDLLSSVFGNMRRTQRVRQVEPLAIEVLNANLQHTRYPVLVGHYLGDPIVSAERAIDGYQQGALGRDHRLGIYPGELNTSRVYGRHQRGSRPGGIVVGLGMVGQLTRPRLQSTLSNALLEYALSGAAQVDGDDAGALCVSSLLIGTWGTRLSVDDSVTALADAAREVNTKLAAETLSPPLRIARIQLVELYRDMASDAVRAARRVAATSDGAITAAPTVTTGRDLRRSRPSSPYGSGWQRHMAIKAKRSGSFSYEHITDLARSDQMTRDVQWAHIKPLLKTVSTDANAPATLFHYLLPYEFAELAKESPDLVLHLDTVSAQVPWEILRPHGDTNEPLGVRLGILRTLTVPGNLAVRRAPGRNALVIGEPLNVQPALPGASAEAKDVTARLEERGLKVNSLVNESADRILSALYEDAYDIIHIAAHGEFPDGQPREAALGREATRRIEAPAGGVDQPKRSGVVLETGRYLTAADFQTLRAVPSIVFLNCCHLGKMPGAAEDVRPSLPGEWGANVAGQLIQMGVGVVVVAGWAVSDNAARTFANALYTGLLDGRNLMSALREARRETYNTSSLGDVTWGAYQVYGSPGFVMRHTQKNPDSPLPAPDPVSHAELVDHLLDIATRAGRPSTDSTSRDLIRELDELRVSLKDTLTTQGDVQCAFGVAYACLNEYPAAAEAYATALKTSEAPLRAAEQLADVEARQAEQWWLEARAGESVEAGLDRKADDAFERSFRRLNSLIEVSGSAERWALLGANRRRRANCTNDASARRALLLEARDAYSAAAAEQPDNRYSYLTLTESMKLCLDPSSVARTELELAKELARPWLDREPFAPLAEPDADLILHAALVANAASTMDLAAGGMVPPQVRLPKEEVDLSRELADRYVAVLESGSDLRRRASVMSHLQSLHQLATHAAVAEWLRLVLESVRLTLGAAPVARPPTEPRRLNVDSRKTHAVAQADEELIG